MLQKNKEPLSCRICKNTGKEEKTLLQKNINAPRQYIFECSIYFIRSGSAAFTIQRFYHWSRWNYSTNVEAFINTNKSQTSQFPKPAVRNR